MTRPEASEKLGANVLADGRTVFNVWAPKAASMDIHLISPFDRIVPMSRGGEGYWSASVEGVGDGARYLYRIGGGAERPDPASHSQPDGVHRPSATVDHGAFAWSDAGWHGLPLEDMILYELHVGTFTPEGTFAAAGKRLRDLADLGINAIEIMPLSSFPGERNWGYDGVHHFAVQESYGGHLGFKAFVDEAHARGIAVVLDVVYNHLGPEGNYLREFGPYFTEKYRSPWGEAINFDDAMSDDVRRFFVENAIHWFENYHVDALRLDAIHGICDLSATPFLALLSERVAAYGSSRKRAFHLIAESDLNDVRAILPRDAGGLGLSGQWCDDFHHALHTLTTGESSGYYADFGQARHLAKALEEGFVYSGQYSAYRRRRHGNSSAGQPRRRMVAFSQNHDQVGNRLRGERLAGLVSFEAQKLAAAAVILSPFIPLIFMGEEYGEDAPFLYFVSHTDPSLIDAVREGRAREFSAFGWDAIPADPQSPETFEASKLCWEKRESGRGALLLGFYRELIRLRKEIPALAAHSSDSFRTTFCESPKIVCFERRAAESSAACLMSFESDTVEIDFPFADGSWSRAISSSSPRFGGEGSEALETIKSPCRVELWPQSLSLFTMEGL